MAAFTVEEERELRCLFHSVSRAAFTGGGGRALLFISICFRAAFFFWGGGRVESWYLHFPLFQCRRADLALSLMEQDRIIRRDRSLLKEASRPVFRKIRPSPIE
jgi:hypothetical protein